MASPVELVQIDLMPRRPQPKPPWLKARAPMGENYHELKKLARIKWKNPRLFALILKIPVTGIYQ